MISIQRPINIKRKTSFFADKPENALSIRENALLIRENALSIRENALLIRENVKPITE